MRITAIANYCSNSFSRARYQDGEVELLLKIGATRHPQTYEPDDDFIVLEDPDGNLFCIVDRSRP